MINKQYLILIPIFITLMGCEQANVGGAIDAGDFEAQRASEVKKWANSAPRDVAKIIESGNAILANENATIEELIIAAKESNAAANFVTDIQKEYGEYYRDNYKYSFIQESVAPAHDKYVSKANELKNIRNTAYMRIGAIKRMQGDELEAFLYYKDAYRLSVFDKGGKDGIRYKAEQEMKDILGLNEIESYTSW